MMGVFRRGMALLLTVSMLLILVACAKKDGESEESAAPLDTEPSEEMVETFDIIQDGKSLFAIVRPDKATQVNIRAASVINNHLVANGLESALSNWSDGSAETREILVGMTKNFPKDALQDIDLSSLGVNGFMIRHYGNKILLVGNNDTALVRAAEFFVANFLDIQGGKTAMPKNYFHIDSNGLFLSALTLGGVNVSNFYVAFDTGLEEPASYVEELVKEKCGVSLPKAGEKKILLTTQGAVANTVTARMEDGNLVIRGENSAALKKAVVCFWYETVAYSTGSFDLPSDFSYTKDLSKTVFYSDFGVVSSNNVCCLQQIYEAHNFANQHGHKVFADYGAQYYISSVTPSVTVLTDVEWGNAKFTIDDSQVTPAQRNHCIFTVPERSGSYTIDTVKTLDRDMTNIGVTLPTKSIVTFHDSNTIHYVRCGANADNGQTKRDSVVVDKNGNIDMDAPLMWDFDKITSIHVLPIDEETRYIGGGVFTTIANRAPSEVTYYSRGIKLSRSNTVVNGIKHYVTGEGDTGGPYHGILYITNCAYVTVKNSVFSGHKPYSAGSYDIELANVISVSFIDCSQANDINDKSLWGIMGSNYCKNMVYDRCVLSRYDAHKGVANGAIKNSVIGHAGASITGYGTFLVENTTVMSHRIVELRSDYGSSWEGEVILRNCVVSPTTSSNVTLISGSNSGTHDFGYACYMPEKVTIDGVLIENAKKAYIFGDLNPQCNSTSYTPQYPFYATKTVMKKNVSSKAKLEVSPNQYLFANTQIVSE